MKHHRLAIVRQKYRPDGGAERFVSRALTALSNQNLELNVITREWQGEKQDDWHIHICDPRKWGRISRERGLRMPPVHCGSSSNLILYKATSVSRAATFTAQAMAFIAAGCCSVRGSCPPGAHKCSCTIATTAT